MYTNFVGRIAMGFVLAFGCAAAGCGGGDVPATAPLDGDGKADNVSGADLAWASQIKLALTALWNGEKSYFESGLDGYQAISDPERRVSAIVLAAYDKLPASSVTIGVFQGRPYAIVTGRRFERKRSTCDGKDYLHIADYLFDESNERLAASASITDCDPGAGGPVAIAWDSAPKSP